MTDSSIYAEIAKAIPVVIGGVLAAVAGVATQFLTHHLAVSRDKGNIKRERLESFVKAMYAYRPHFHDRFFTMCVLDKMPTIPGPFSEPQAALSEARMIQDLYFPELREEVLKVLESDSVFDDLVLGTKFPIENLEHWQRDNLKTLLKALHEYEIAMTTLTEKCRKLLA
jgi:hypothetical protein